MNEIKKLKLKKILSNHFIKFSLLPILIVEITLLILYFSINKYISIKNTDFLLNQAQINTKELLKKESTIINDKLVEISQLARILQREHESIFSNPPRFIDPNNQPQFAFADNKVFYKTNKKGSSLYYSAKTEITAVERNKAIFTEAMDGTLKNIVDVNKLAVAAYFNSWDNMNRLYPFIDNVSTQYGEHIQMQDYNFYYLADKEHNPKRKAVWTGAYLDPAGLGWMLSCIVPIYKNDFLEGVTGIDITIDNFVKNILNQEFLYDAKLFIVDNNGMIIAMPEKIEELLGLKELKEHLYTDSILKTIEKPEDYNIIKKNNPFSKKFENLIKNNTQTETLNINENQYLSFAQNVDETNWKLIILINKDNLSESIENLSNLSNKIGYLAIGFLFLFYVIFFYTLLKRINLFSEKITEPLVDLSNQTTLITKKNIEFKNVETNIEEISQLNNNFIYMLNVLNQRSKKLYEANKTKDYFLANMSHELKTPLNSISIISTIMSQNKNNILDSSSHKNIKIINKSAEDLTRLINDILDISKIEAGKLTINKKNISLKDLIEDLYDLFCPIAQNKNIEFINNFQINNTDIFTDEHRTKQIIKNLVDNAIKFTNKGKVELLSKEFENYFEISIIDSGIGIGKENLNYIFDRFKQVDDSMTKKHQGTGLGLAISKELSTLLNGHISVTSELGVGSIFKYIIYKKRNEVLSENNNEAEIDTPESKESNFLFNKVFLTKQIYLFHSNSMEQLTLTISLKKYGLNVIPILNEKKLKEKINDIKSNNHLIILDSKIENFQNIINDEKLIKLNLMILEESESIENLIEKLKSIQLFNKESNNE